MAIIHGEAGAMDARGSERRRALLGATLRTAAGERRCNILNLSTGGALLDASDPPAAGEPVTLARQAMAAPGRVGWVNGHRFGVTFDHGIDDALVATITEYAAR